MSPTKRDPNWKWGQGQGQEPEPGERARKAEAYRADLKAQVDEKNARKKAEKEKDQQASQREDRNFDHGYDPYGRAGAGAPNRDARGQIVADLRAAGAVGISGADGRGDMEGYNREEGGDPGRRRDPNAPHQRSPYRQQPPSAPVGRVSPSVRRGDSFSSPMDSDAEHEAMDKAARQKQHSLDLMRQIDEKRLKKEREVFEQRQSDSRDDLRMRQDMGGHEVNAMNGRAKQLKISEREHPTTAPNHAEDARLPSILEQTERFLKSADTAPPPEKEDQRKSWAEREREAAREEVRGGEMPAANQGGVREDISFLLSAQENLRKALERQRSQVARLTSSASVDAFARNIAKQDLDQHRHTLLAGLSADPLPAWAPLPPVRVAARTPTSFARKAASILEPLNHPAQHAPAHRGFGGGSQAPPTLFGPSPALSFPPPSYESLNGDLGAPPWDDVGPAIIQSKSRLVFPSDGPDYAGAGAGDDLEAPLPSGGPVWEPAQPRGGAVSIDALIERNRRRLTQLRQSEAQMQFLKEPALGALMGA